jgi:hypothetical protein
MFRQKEVQAVNNIDTGATIEAGLSLSVAGGTISAGSASREKTVHAIIASQD